MSPAMGVDDFLRFVYGNNDNADNRVQNKIFA
jgi:hypothetical protein